LIKTPFGVKNPTLAFDKNLVGAALAAFVETKVSPTLLPGLNKRYGDKHD